MSDPQLTHTDASGAAHMVDVSGKRDTLRSATAGGTIRMSVEAFDAISRNAVAKGDVLAVARIAGITAAKRTSELVPLCHVVPLSGVEVQLSLDAELPGVAARATATATGPTGVEMEAIVAVAIALTTVYDMAKSIDRTMLIGDIHLLRKRGGKSGDFSAD